jgi:low temperature requirement protein LtrA
MSNFREAQWWGPPKKFEERKSERKISWLELFYDLVYVAAIGQLTHHIAAHPTWPVLGFALLLFSLVFWSWVNGSQYYDLHGSDSVRTRLTTFWQMLSVAAVAITIPDAFEGHHQVFAIAFCTVQLLITYLWWSVGLYDPSHRVFNIYYTVNYLIAFALLIASIFTSNGTATILWGLALVFNLTPPITAARTVVTVLKERGQVFTASAAIVERFGLFTIIVLAESILNTVTGIAEIQDKSAEVWIAFMLAVLISFLLWSIYFDMTSEQETKKGYNYMQWLVYLHFPLLAALSAAGACFKVVLTQNNSVLPVHIQWIFCIALATILFSIVAISGIMQEDEEDRAFIKPTSPILIASGLLCLAIPLTGREMNSLAFLGIIALLLFVPVVVGISSWIRYAFLGSDK